jgi:hypothetical protein
MADPGSYYAQAGQNLGNDIQDAMQQYHKEHVAYDQQDQLATTLSRLGIDATGNPTVAVDAEGKPVQGVTPIIDPKALATFKTGLSNKRAAATGSLEALNRLLLTTTGKAIASKIEDASLSGQATKQRMTQQDIMFPLEVAGKKASTEREQQIIEQEKAGAGKVNVPGLGMMTPSQASAAIARQKRLDILQQRNDPAHKFEDSLQTNYGLDTPTVIAATKGQFPAVNSDGTTQKDAEGKDIMYQGVPFVDVAGNQVEQKGGQLKVGGKAIKYDVKDPNVWAVVGPNQAHVPVHEWSQIVSKAKMFEPRLKALSNEQKDLSGQNQQDQAKAVMAMWGKQDPSTLAPDQQAALQKAKDILGQ